MLLMLLVGLCGVANDATKQLNFFLEEGCIGQNNVYYLR